MATRTKLPIPIRVPSPPSLRELTAGYGRTRPLGPYLALLSGYALVTAAGVTTGVRRRRGVPRIRATDAALLAVGTFKLSRLITKGKVTSFVRAPFTEYVEPGDAGEVNEKARGHGLQHAVGELLTCPFCFSQWTATGLFISWLHAPRATRAFGTMLAVSAAVDVLHVAWTRLEDAA